MNILMTGILEWVTHIFECNIDEYELHFSQRDGDWLETKCPDCGARVVRDLYVKGENND